MAAKKGKTRYICSECGYSSLKWLGKCPNCDSWGTFEEEIDIKRTFKDVESQDVSISKITEIEIEKEFRMVTPFEEFDRVLGGGLIKGEVVLITGSPGIGKSTFLLQLSQEYAKIGNVFYVSGEESPRQIKQRAERVNVKSENLYILNDTNIEKIESVILKDKPKVVVIDSIQTLYSENVNSIPGSVTQIRETTLKIIEIAKKNEIAFYIVGHVTKDGKLAGPKLLEHMVDAVLQIEGEENSYYRIIRSIKNRYGSTNEISIFDMKENGISEVKNPSEFFISDRDEKNIGSIIVPIFEGSRVFLFEVQSLLGTPNFGMPRRTVEGYDKNRVEILSAVLSRSLKVDVNSKDIYINIPGGIDLNDRSSDLAVIFSLLSSVKGVPISQKIAAIGELGLRGEVRKVSFIKNRVNELEKMGFTGVYLPKSHQADFEKEKIKIKLNYISNISELVERIR
ncbi:DNA repair protein RadA [Leptotrichia wadei]|uniref:DNA repair protein RadA n=2 Tax=Leptotrichia wadei TaxID=157687 RepID=A0A510KDY1_9FUSO|nr:DNA repair protein RadA [Leptotrichia wadei]ERK48678.1 DNA repair protein RadA [Leptotrichia wadei F0279]BBM47587.1 DNA repair protein RadA [Leptotrichia wadei]BBM49889.1 DNA repair protein RadA [Leptotrichia wadei]